MLVVDVPHHSLTTGAVLQRCCISVLVGMVENMSSSPRQSTRSPRRGCALNAASTKRGVIALMTTCVVGNARTTARTTRAAFASEISWPEPHVPLAP